MTIRLKIEHLGSGHDAVVEVIHPTVKLSGVVSDVVERHPITTGQSVEVTIYGERYVKVREGLPI